MMYVRTLCIDVCMYVYTYVCTHVCILRSSSFLDSFSTTYHAWWLFLRFLLKVWAHNSLFHLINLWRTNCKGQDTWASYTGQIQTLKIFKQCKRTRASSLPAEKKKTQNSAEMSSAEWLTSFFAPSINCLLVRTSSGVSLYLRIFFSRFETVSSRSSMSQSTDLRSKVFRHGLVIRSRSNIKGKSLPQQSVVVLRTSFECGMAGKRTTTPYLSALRSSFDVHSTSSYWKREFSF